MAPSIGISVIALALLAGCGSTLSTGLAPGLANAPALGKDTPETRVHDVVANDHDACERSGFPPGEVLRGHVPPCATERGAPIVTTFFPEPASRPRSTPWHGLGVCASAGEGLKGTEVALAGMSQSTREVACEAPW